VFVFTPARVLIWIIIYSILGVSIFFIWIKGVHKIQVKEALFLFGFSLFLIFFGLLYSLILHNPGWSLVEEIAQLLA